MSNYDTNLASEFFVLSTLHRLGAEASLTLGNKKSVDIFVSHGRRTLSIDVKGVAGRYDWPAGNIPAVVRPRHFVVLVSYNGMISDPTQSPDVWVVPHGHLKPFVRQYRGRRNISRAAVTREGSRFHNAWWRIVGRRTG